MLPESAVPSYTLEEILLWRKHNTSQLIYLISVADEESLLVRGYLHRDDNCMTWIHHRISRFGPQGLECYKVQQTSVSLWCNAFYTWPSKSKCMWSKGDKGFSSKWAYTFGGGSSKADDSTEFEDWVWKQLLTRGGKKFILKMSQQLVSFHSPLFSALTLCLMSLDNDRWTGCGTGVQTSWEHNKINSVSTQR